MFKNQGVDLEPYIFFYLFVTVEIPSLSDAQQLDGTAARKIRLYREGVVS